MISQRWLFPDSQERQYQRLMRRLLFSLVSEFVRRLRENNLLRIDSDEETFSDEMAGITAGVIAYWLLSIQDIRAQMGALFVGVNQFNDNQFIKVIKSMFGVILPNSSSVMPKPGTLVTQISEGLAKLGPDADLSRIEQWVRTLRTSFEDKNISAVDIAGRELVVRIEQTVRTEVAKGTPINEIVTQIETQRDRITRREQLRARDEMGTLNSEMTKRRMLSVGIKQYVWNTCMDERVRGNPGGRYPKAIPSHWAREKKVFSWSDPPDGGHPGEAWLCRCWATPFKKIL